MRRLIYLIYILLVATSLTGCKIDDGEVYEPTRMGRQLFYITADTMGEESELLTTLLQFNEYLAAPTEQAREEVHNRYFYTSRIFETKDGWHIVNSNKTLVINTGGKLLSEVGAEWNSLDNDKYPLSTAKYLTRLADEAGDDRAVYQFITSQTNKYTVKVREKTTLQGGASKSEYEFSFSGRGTASRHSIYAYFEILEPTICVSTYSQYLYGGKLRLWCFDGSLRYEVTAAPEVYGGSVTISYNDHNKSYNQ